jgi:hypothetical protein
MDQLPTLARHPGFRPLSIDALMHPHSRPWLGAITRLLSKEVARA